MKMKTMATKQKRGEQESLQDSSSEIELEIAKGMEQECRANAELEKRYVLGYEDGFKDGIESGWDTGFADGYDEATWTMAKWNTEKLSQRRSHKLSM